MAAPILALRDIHVSFGRKALLEGAELAVLPGSRIGLVGRNGSGKSTLLKVAAGEIEPDRGERVVQQGISIRYLPQEPDLTGVPTVLDYVLQGLGEGDAEHRARYLLGELGLASDLSTANLSGGEARRAALARALAPEPDVLLLDEPTNHLDLPAIEWLEKELGSIRSAIVTISHDRRFLERLSRTTVWLDRGAVRVLDKSFAHFEAWRDEVLEQEELDRHKLDRKIVREEHWIRYGVTARRKRNVRRVAELADLRQQRRDQRKVTGQVEMSASEGPMSGKLVIEAKGISKTFGKRAVVNDFSIRVGRGDRVGIVGPNGAGKTTLVNLLTDVLAPDAGTVRHGAALELVTLDQKREALNPEWTLQEALTGGRGDTVKIGGVSKHIVSYMKDFLFDQEQARTPLRVLSGGERGRLMLARALAKPSNLLVLDEPTNDLDLETLDLLIELIGDYSGTAIVVSHDRDFLDKVATSVLLAEPDGQFTEYAGGYSDMVAQRGSGVEARAGDVAKPKAAAEPRAPAFAQPKRKLSFKEKHALETLPKRMDSLQADITRLDKVLADPALYARDPQRYNDCAAALANARANLGAAEDEWLALEILKEELDA